MTLRKKRILIIVSAVLAFSLTLTGVLLILFACSDKYYNYIKEDLTPYVSVTAESLQGYTVSIDPRKVISDDDVEAEIYAALLQYGEEKSYPDAVPTASDTVSLLYRVTLDGKDIYGFTNYYSDTDFTVSLSAPTGDEKDPLPSYYLPIREALHAALVDAGKAPSHYGLKEKKEGTVTYGNTVYANVRLDYIKDKVEKKDNYTAVRLSIPANDAEIQNAVSPYSFLPDGLYRKLLQELVGMEFGKTASGEMFVSAETRDYDYTLSPLFAVTEENGIPISLSLPADFDKGGSLSHLAGKEVVFYAVPTAVVRLEVPVLDDAYAEKLTDGVCKGEGAADSFRAVLKEYMQMKADNVYTEALYQALIEEMVKKIQPADYPARALEDAERDALGLFRSSYDGYVAENGTGAFPTLEAYLNDTFEVATDEERIAIVDGMVKDVVAEYLAVYQAAKFLNIMPTEKELQEAYEDSLAALSESEIESFSYYYGSDYLYRQIEYAVVREAVLSSLPYTNSPPQK